MRSRLRIFLTVCLLTCAPGLFTSSAQSTAPAARDPWLPFNFLIGTWEAKTASGTADAKVSGIYSFAPELRDHILARHGGSANCKAPTDFDCEHSDQLYLYPEGAGIKAIYFDNEGHVIHYDVTTPTPTSAVFLSDPAIPGPQFRLIYERKDAILAGKFQIRMPGQTEFKSYLEWSGGHR